MIDQKEINRILQKTGDVRGAVFQTDAYYIAKFGQDVKLVEEKLKQWGVPLIFGEIKSMAWYPVAWRVLSLLAIKEVFGWGDEEISKMGESAPKVSIIVKLFFKLFPDIEKFAQQIPHYWRKHYTIGELEVISLDKEKREMILHLKNFCFHSILCRYLEGYFKQATKLTRPEDSVVSAKEIECSKECSSNNNCSYEVFQLNWTK